MIISFKALVLSLFVLFANLAYRIAQAQEMSDPLEPVNRAIFSFNDTVDEYILTPVARGYKAVFPSVVRRGVTNFFDNLRTPIYVVSDLVQFKGRLALRHTGRFVLNTAGGFLGFVDIASGCPGLGPQDEDFGQALGYHGIPPGPYLVLPLLGPSDARDLFGRIVDSFLTPTYYVDDTWTVGGAKALEVVNDRERLLEAVDVAKESSMDYYVFIRSSFSQRRASLIEDGESSGEELFPPEAPSELPDKK